MTPTDWATMSPIARDMASPGTQLVDSHTRWGPTGMPRWSTSLRQQSGGRGPWVELASDTATAVSHGAMPLHTKQQRLCARRAPPQTLCAPLHATTAVYNALALLHRAGLVVPGQADGLATPRLLQGADRQTAGRHA